MPSDFSAVRIKENIYWVGVVDWNVRNFHGYITDSGTTYNAYLVIDEKITLFDTVKKGFGTELLERVASVIDPADIDYIVSNHAEPDHSGELSYVMEKVSPEKVFASKMGVKALEEHYPELEGRIESVNNGEVLSLGEKSVKFMETRMIHWPDSMFSFLVEDALLISQDAFGMHMASGERFADLLPSETLFRHAAGYYSNIVTLYSKQISRLLKKVEEMNLKINIIAPDHGPIWRESDNIDKIISLYRRWSSRKVSPKLVVFYDTMWHSTEKMARYIEDAALSSGIKVVSMSLSSSDRSEIATEMLDAAAVAVGSPTMNNHLFPTCADVLTYLKGLKFKTPFGASFGSFGWSGEAVKQIDTFLADMVDDNLGSVRGKYRPDDDVKQKCIRLGKKIAETVMSHVSDDDKSSNN